MLIGLRIYVTNHLFYIGRNCVQVFGLAGPKNLFTSSIGQIGH